jgi:bifunctional non-homologous end joining protein LigD
MSNPNLIKTTTLYSQKNGSDKVYMLQLNMLEDGSYKIYYGNGKRGSTLKIKEKSKTPLNKEESLILFDEIIKDKKTGSNKYKESLDNGETLEISSNSGKESGIDTHLLVKIDKEEALRLCNDDNYVAQEKHDGERRPLLIKKNEVSGTNRYGEFTSGMKSGLKKGIDLSDNVIFDTEDMGNFVIAFDILEYQGEDLKNKGFLKRYNILEEAVKKHKTIRLSPIAITTEEKLALLERMIKGDREGLVFKLANAKYVGGKATKKTATQFKYKLYEEASVLVESVNVKRSVAMVVFDADGNKLDMGNVTISSNKEVPSVGDVIEVKYLYVHGVGGKMFQSEFLRKRTDQRISECLETQLKYKAIIE